MPDKIAMGSGLGGVVAGATLALFGIKKTIKAELKECFANEAKVLKQEVEQQGKAIACLKESKKELVTTIRCDDKITATAKLVDMQFQNHSDHIKRLEKAQTEGFKAIFEKLDRIIANGGS